MNLTDNRLSGLDSPDLTPDQRARIRCRVAADSIHGGQYEKAREALGDLWQGTGERPNVHGLWETTAAEVLLQCGSLTGWLGTSKKVEGAQDKAKDLIGEARRLFEAHGLRERVGEAEYELGICYWRAGGLDEARVILREALRKVGGNDELKAKVLIRSTLVEVSAGRYNDALKILDEAEGVFSASPDAIKGRWHGQRGMVLRRLGAAEGRADYLDRAIIEFTAAAFHFEQAGHERYCGNAENNLAMLLNRMGRYAEAHKHLDSAQRIFTRLGDAGSVAQVRETGARVYLAEGLHDKAADAIESAVGGLEQAGELALLADALTVQATIEARRGHHYLSLPTFRRAIKIAEQAGASESAGAAALSLLEEHGASRLSEKEAFKVYCHADDLLRRTQDAELISRLRASARSVARRLAGLKMGEGFSLTEAVKDYEAKFIQRALADAEGSVSRAATRLGINYQKLVYLLETRHRHLLPARTPARKRRRSIIKKK
jgi:tetratricopeptide (TPR) repeat protein